MLLMTMATMILMSVKNDDFTYSLNDDDYDDYDDGDDWWLLLTPQSQILLHNERDKNQPNWGDTWRHTWRTATRVRLGCCYCREEWGVVTVWATITTFSSLAAEYRPPDIIGSPRCSSGTAGNSTDRSRTEADRFRRRSSCWPSGTGWPSGTASRAAWFGRCTASLARQTPDP